MCCWRVPWHCHGRALPLGIPSPPPSTNPPHPASPQVIGQNFPPHVRRNFSLYITAPLGEGGGGGDTICCGRGVCAETPNRGAPV